MSVEPFRLEDTRVLLLDQTELPAREVWLPVATADQMVEAIASMRVRGAPAIGIAAALGLWVEAERATEQPCVALGRLREVAAALKRARPTAINLARATERVLAVAEAESKGMDARVWAERIRAEALAIWNEDRAASEAMALHGAGLFKRERRFLTHCHSGGLATGGGGTALAVLFHLKRAGREIRVWATETRPLLQGARLTAWELCRAGIPVTLVADAAAPSIIARGEIEAVIVGADRIARNGDVANKIGTYPLALAARAAGVPFVVVAPTTTLDPAAKTGSEIPIEERDPGEVLMFQGQRLAPEECGAANPAFDVTPADLVTTIVTERGVFTGPSYSFGPH